ncbi:transposable element Tc1 transposase [Trichonephila clavipes]|nr:transposable element Tc1 transposase [Trichonephila clavipes]
MINGRTRLHVVANGTMTGQRYIDEVLLPHVRLFRGAVGDNFFYGQQRNMSSNTRCRPRGQVAGRNYPPINKNTLIRALTEEWDKLPQQLLDNVVQKEVNKVSQIFRRIMDITMTLAMCSLPFRRHRETRDSTQRGNLLNIIELLAKYNHLLNAHLSEKRTQNYLSPKIQNEVIAIIGSRIKENIVLKI